MSEKPILQIIGLNKSFGSTLANINVNLSLEKGEIRGLIGENGSGKSTLLSQIAGVYGYDSGEMLLNGEHYAPSTPLDANHAKISMVMQELGVIDNLPVGINMFLGRLEQFSSGGVVNMKLVNKAADEVFKKWDLPEISLNARLSGMLIEQRKMIELARAMSVDPDILLLDEITQSLSLNYREKLYALIKKFKAMGKSVIVITHDIDEMLAISDTITVLRDGQVVGNVNAKESTADQIRYMMVGRQISGDYYRDDKAPSFENEIALTAKDVTVPGEVEDISFELHKGEILGFCGLSDSGIHSIGTAVYGLSKLSSGDIRLGDGYDVKHASECIHHNMAYVPKDRDNDALMIHAGIFENCTLPSLTELQGPVGYLSPAKLKKLTSDTIKNLSVKCTGIYQPMDALSGGNKQKVNLGRWLAKDLKVLILDCPTRGVDVGVKSYIYSLMKQAKKDGIAVILISDELTEILGMSDRVIIMKDGRMKKTISRGEDFTEHSVIGVMI